MSEIAGEPNPVPPVTQQASQSVTVTEVPPGPLEATPATYGVDQASFDKYYKDGKFDWESYGTEIEFKQKQNSEPKAEPAKEPATPDAQGAQEAVNNAGLDWDGLGAKVATDGDISPEDYAALANIGIPDTVVKNYVDMVKADAQNIIDSVIDEFGGQEHFNQVHAALFVQASVEERNRVDDLLRDPLTRSAGVALANQLSGLSATAQQPAAQPQQPAPSRAAAPQQQPDIQGFASFEEQVAAQSDPRYNREAAYTNEVIAKIGASAYQVNPRAHGGGL